MTARVLINTVSLSSGALTRERHLLRALAHHDHPHKLYVLATPNTAESLPDADRFVVHHVSSPAGTPRRLLWENTGLLRWIRRLDPDLLSFPLHITNLVDFCPKLSAIRNAAPFFPRVVEEASPRRRLRLRALRLATRRTIAQSERVVFMSDTTKETVASYIPAASEKGIVVPHGVPDGFEPTAPTPEIFEGYDLPEQFLLCVSNLVPYKNLAELIEGYARARDDVSLPPLCIAGKTIDSEYERAIRERIATHRLGDQVRLLGFVNHEDLPALHTASELFLFSSVCENAPVSVVEALACGATVATSDAASMPEICGDAAAYFDADDPNSISETLVSLWEDPQRRERLSAAALEQAAQFSWDRAARETSEIFKAVVRGDNA